MKARKRQIRGIYKEDSSSADDSVKVANSNQARDKDLSLLMDKWNMKESIFKSIPGRKKTRNINIS